MLEYKIQIKLYVLSCMLICCVYGDTIQAEAVVLCLLFALYSMTCFHFKLDNIS
jgi:hypothetical protein